MEILIVMTTSPFGSQTGSGIVALNTIKHLLQQHKITLIHPGASASEGHAFGINVIAVEPSYASRASKQFLRILNSARLIPPSFTTHQSDAMNAQVKKFLKANAVDRILLFELTAIQYIPTSALKITFANIEDPQALKLEAIARLEIWSTWQKLKIRALAVLTARYEKKMLGQLAEVYLLSSADVTKMMARTGLKNLSHIPYGVDSFQAIHPTSFTERDQCIIFSGSMFHPSNIDAVLYFIAKIFPLVTARHPTIRLLIVGAHPDPRIIAAAADHGSKIEVTGKVPVISSYIKRALVSICPIRVEIGVQTKVLEAMSLGTPVVTTSAGNSGINAVSGKHLYVANNPIDFANRVSDLLDGINWDSVSANGRLFAHKCFDWSSSAKLTEHRLTSFKFNE
jgi:glycosyltransferase involved in cell wall biosynthesis